jgi:hypothetical protein
VGVSLLTVGEFGQGFEHIKQGSRIYDRSQHSRVVQAYGQDSGVLCLSYEAFCLGFLVLCPINNFTESLKFSED